MQGAVSGTMLYKEPILHGDNETVQKKKSSTFVESSHRPSYAMEKKQRQTRGRTQKKNLNDAKNPHVNEINF